MRKLIQYRWILTGGLVAALSLGMMAGHIGCSGISAGARVARNIAGRSYVRVSLNGQEAQQSTLKRAVVGQSTWDIPEPVTQEPLKFSYTITEPEKIGRITFTAINVYQEFQGKYSNQAEFIITPRDMSADYLLKDNEVYNLSNPPEYLRVLDIYGNELQGVELKPDTKYKLQFTLQADNSETASIVFKTR